MKNCIFPIKLSLGMHTQQQPREQCMDAGAFMHQFMCSNIPFHLHAHRKCIDCLTTKCANLLRVYEYEPTNTPYPFAPAQTRPICSQPRRMRYIAQKQTAATMDTPLKKHTHSCTHTARITRSNFAYVIEPYANAGRS